MDALLIHTEKNNLLKIIEFLNSLKVNFEIIKDVEKSIYSQEFQLMMDVSIEQSNSGKVRKLSLDEVWK